MSIPTNYYDQDIEPFLQTTGGPFATVAVGVNEGHRREVHLRLGGRGHGDPPVDTDDVCGRRKSPKFEECEEPHGVRLALVGVSPTNSIEEPCHILYIVTQDIVSVCMHANKQMPRSVSSTHSPLHAPIARMCECVPMELN